MPFPQQHLKLRIDPLLDPIIIIPLPLTAGTIFDVLKTIYIEVEFVLHQAEVMDLGGMRVVFLAPGACGHDGMRHIGLAWRRGMIVVDLGGEVGGLHGCDIWVAQRCEDVCGWGWMEALSMLYTLQCQR